MKRRTVIGFTVALLLTAAAAVSAFPDAMLPAVLAAGGVVGTGVAFTMSSADDRAMERKCEARLAAVDREQRERDAVWTRNVASLEAEIARAQADAQAASTTRRALGEALGLLRETAPIIDGLAKKAIEKSERGSTSLTEDVYRIGRQSTSLSSSITGFLNEMSRGDDSLESSIGCLNEGVAQLGEVGGLYDRANESLDTSITRVSQSVGETSELIGKVADIAEQTSILAINAAIYAAKAGEFGRGFSVIAGEIQTLAANAKIVAETIGTNTITIERQVGEFSNIHRGLMKESQGALSRTIESIERTIAGLQPKVERISASVQTAAGVSASVTESLNEINMAMQEQDAIQQIVAHISDILHESLERIPASAAIETVDGEGLDLKDRAREIAARHFTMKDEFVAVGHDGYRAEDRATAVLEDGTELGGDVTLF